MRQPDMLQGFFSFPMVVIRCFWAGYINLSNLSKVVLGVDTFELGCCCCEHRVFNVVQSGLCFYVR